MPDEPKNYDQVKIVLLQSVGETVGKFGAKFLSLSSETIKSMSADECIEYVSRTIKVMFQKCKNVDDCVFTLARVAIENKIPHSGNEFLESRDPKDLPSFINAYSGWLNTRKQGNFFHIVSSPRPVVKSDRYAVCYKCNKPGHRFFECRTRPVTYLQPQLCT